MINILNDIITHVAQHVQFLQQLNNCNDPFAMQRRRKNGMKRRRMKRKRKTCRGQKNKIPLGKRKLNKIGR